MSEISGGELRGLTALVLRDAAALRCAGIDTGASTAWASVGDVDASRCFPIYGLLPRSKPATQGDGIRRAAVIGNADLGPGDPTSWSQLSVPHGELALHGCVDHWPLNARSLKYIRG